jgi:aquaporin Z
MSKEINIYKKTKEVHEQMKCCKLLMKDGRKYIAEMIGTMILTIVGLGAVLYTNDTIAVAFAFGLALMAVICIIGPISGSHVNPAVSLGFALRKKLSWKDFGFYVCAQIVGALLGCLAIFIIVLLHTKGTGSVAQYFESFSATYSVVGLPAANTIAIALLIDIAMTFVFVLAILGIVRKVENKFVAAIEIGLILTALVLSGAALNPAIALGNAIFGGVDALKEVWVFLVGPLVGGALAAVVACLLFKGEEKEETKTESTPTIKEPTKTTATTQTK